jgi:DNA-directed RNA polymerase subunit RPC12/RpoP
MTNHFPPDDFIQTQSAIEGILVYKPKPPEEGQQQKIVDFKCPQCGATTAFSAADGGLTCAYCGYFEAPQVETVGKNAQKFEFTVETMQRASHGWGTSRKALVCQNCGAQTTVPEKMMTYSCAFCGSNKVIQKQADQNHLRPRFLIPFMLEPDQCLIITQEWIGSSWMTPAKLRQASQLNNFNGVYLPYWTFDSTTRAAWKAQVGHIETERYFSDGKWKTRQVTVWRWESGKAQLDINDLIIPGTSRLSQKLIQETKSYSLEALVPYEPKFLAGLQASNYDIGLEEAWEIGRKEIRDQTRQACLSQTSTHRVRNFSMSMDFADETWRYILLPVYLNTYIYEHKTYQMMINAQTGAISGQRPVDWRKIWIAIALILSPGIILGIIGLITTFFAGIGVMISTIGFLLLMIGVVASFFLWKKADSFDDL